MAIAQILLCIAASCVAAEAAPDDPAAGKVDFYLSSMLTERQKLRSGEFVISGTRSATNSEPPRRDYSGRIIIDCALDENRIRVDNLESSVPSGIPQAKLRKMWAGGGERKFIRTQQRSVTWNGNERNNILIRPPDSQMFGPFLFFDVRGLGLMTWEELTDPEGSNVETTIAAFKEGKKERSVDTSDPKYVQLVFSTELIGWRNEQRFWLRPDQGFAPVKLETRTHRPNYPDDSWQVNERGETSWEQIGDVWLPVKFEMTQLERVGQQKLAWKIRWRSVNQPIDDSRFGWKDFGAPETVIVVDTTGAQPVVIRGSR